LKLVNRNIGLGITIDDSLVEQLFEATQKHSPKEFGGFLVGHYSSDFTVLIITDTILPTKFKATNSLFERDTKGIENDFFKFYEQSPSKYYVGEWHTHPNGLPIPSNTDLTAIKAILNHEDVAIRNPIFLIIGKNRNMMELAFYVPFKNKLYRYEQQD